MVVANATKLVSVVILMILVEDGPWKEVIDVKSTDVYNIRKNLHFLRSKTINRKGYVKRS